MAELGETLHGLEADGRQTESSPGAGRVSKLHPHKPESEFVNPGRTRGTHLTPPSSAKATAIPSPSQGILLESRPKPRGQFVSGVFGVWMCHVGLGRPNFSAASAKDDRSQTVLKGVASSQTGPSTGVMPKAVTEGVDLGIDTAAGRFSGSVAPSCGGGDDRRNKLCQFTAVQDKRSTGAAAGIDNRAARHKLSLMLCLVRWLRRAWPPTTTGYWPALHRCGLQGCGEQDGGPGDWGGGQIACMEASENRGGVWMGFAWYPDNRQKLTWPAWLASRSGVPWPGQLRSEKGEERSGRPAIAPCVGKRAVTVVAVVGVDCVPSSVHLGHLRLRLSLPDGQWLRPVDLYGLCPVGGVASA
ncbi:hypothetical protein CH63R_11741 [Colletotrichum higginsianum IMI 349063]|uniref:Uncharacterized protein n=1 Tax=Colletotrichum higginsianum (strain IMI 349063) TaxID=759273 RepID=A0A1B7XZ30_COLHI|nr:hypothetical protein CH63R_11741 [Colletotrichum higginsianum IMI 349063]OBR05038.1 hypothetical protein CH63R_11741 [Colletotrichum higginsianum IMI 349063]